MTIWPETELGVVAPYVKEKVDASILDASNFISTDNMLPNVGGITLSDYVPTTGKVAAYQTNDVLVSNIRPYFKKIWRVRQSGGCSNDVLIFRANPKKISPKFLYYQLSQSDFFDFMMAGANGVKMPRGNRNLIPKYKFLLPPLPIQQKIAGILAAYDDLIENNLKRIKLLEEMAQITYEEWFVRLRFPDHKSTPINPETGLPEGWETKTISTICDVNKNSITARNAPETIRYIDISSAETGYYTTPQEMTFAEAPSRARRRVAFGDTIFSTVRPNRRIFSLVLENDPLLVASTGFAVLTPHWTQNFPFIYLTIAQQSFTDAAVAVAGGAAYPAVNQTDFERIKITVPTQELINKFSDVFVPNFTIKGQLQREIELLREARDILLPRLMTGVIDVESYDPAKLDSRLRGNDKLTLRKHSIST